MSLQQPTQKMSKSNPDTRSRILLTDTADEIRAKIFGALTDSVSSTVSYDPATRPGVSNLVELLSLLEDEGARGRSPADVAEELAGSSLKELKERVAEAVIASLRGIRERYFWLLDEDGGKYLDRVQEEGARRARESAEATMEVVKAAVGLR